MIYVTPETEAEPSAPEPAATDAASVRNSSALLKVSVPENAQVYINGQLTKSTGSERSYFSRNLDRNRRYEYTVMAKYTDAEGQPQERQEIVQLMAGGERSLAFGDSSTAAAKVAEQPQPTEPAVTSLKVHLPADAKLSLAGNATSSSGATRVFNTEQLAPGTRWENYLLKASIVRDGQMVEKQQVISLAAGESREVFFDFETANVARVAAAVR